MDMESFELVILRSPEQDPGYDSPAQERLQGEHLAYLGWLREAGHSVGSGPLGDRVDEGMRGLVFYRTGSVAEARRLAGQDPAVRAGLLEPQVMTWYCAAGTFSLPGRPVHFDRD